MLFPDSTRLAHFHHLSRLPHLSYKYKIVITAVARSRGNLTTPRDGRRMYKGYSPGYSGLPLGAMKRAFNLIGDISL